MIKKGVFNNCMTATALLIMFQSFNAMKEGPLEVSTSSLGSSAPGTPSPVSSGRASPVATGSLSPMPRRVPLVGGTRALDIAAHEPLQRIEYDPNAAAKKIEERAEEIARLKAAKGVFDSKLEAASLAQKAAKTTQEIAEANKAAETYRAARILQMAIIRQKEEAQEKALIAQENAKTFARLAPLLQRRNSSTIATTPVTPQGPLPSVGPRPPTVRRPTTPQVPQSSLPPVDSRSASRQSTSTSPATPRPASGQRRLSDVLDRIRANNPAAARPATPRTTRTGA